MDPTKLMCFKCGNVEHIAAVDQCSQVKAEHEKNTRDNVNFHDSNHEILNKFYDEKRKFKENQRGHGQSKMCRNCGEEQHRGRCKTNSANVAAEVDDLGTKVAEITDVVGKFVNLMSKKEKKKKKANAMLRARSESPPPRTTFSALDSDDEGSD